MFEERRKIPITSKMENLKNTSIGIRIFSISILIIAYLMLNTENILAQSLTSQRTLSFDSRYVIQGYSNKAVGQFGIELFNLATLPANLIVKPDTSLTKGDKKFLFYDSHQLRNVANGLLLFAGSIFIKNSFQFAYHEYGHGTRLAAIGFKASYGHSAIANDADLQAILSGEVKLYDNLFYFYLSSLFDATGFTIIIEEDTLFSPLYNELNNNGWDGLLQMGGFNNEMLFSEFIEDEMHRNGGHIGFLIPYINGKLAAQNYPTTGVGVFNDVTNIISYYQGRGYNIDNDKISKGDKVSLFTSTLSYQLVYQFLNMLSGKSSRFHPWEFRGIELPNTLFYMNRSGLSYKIRSGYRFGEWRFPFALEYVFEGEKRTEVGFGAEKQFDNLTTAFEAIIGKRLEFAMDVSYRQSKWLMISGGYALYDERNLHGERLIPSLEHGSTYHDFYLRASLTY